MSSTTSRRKHKTELASFHSAFLADDTLVTIVPSFDSPDRIPLLSAPAVGPFKAGIPTNVPLWLAMLLQQRSLCRLKVPEWLQTEHLTKVKQFEMNETYLTPSEDTHQNHDNAENNSTPTLPFYYAELGQRFTSAKTSASDTTAAQAPKASSLVLADILQIRLDKLRQQFQTLTQAERHNPNLCVQVPGIASVELAQMKPLILQALQDQRFLATSAAAAVTVSDTRRSTRKTAAGEDDDDDDEPLTASQESRPDDSHNALRSRIRRFRG